MAAPSHPDNSQPGVGMIILFVVFLAFAAIALLGFIAGGFVAGAVFPILVAVGLIAYAINFLVQRRRSEAIVASAREAGAPSPADFWGKVVMVSGTCPSGPTPEEGETFIVAGRQIWPTLCPHAEEAVFALISRIDEDEVETSEPARVHDNDHHIMMEVHRAPKPERKAA